MFDASNWIYLAASFGFGFGIRELIAKMSKTQVEKSSVTDRREDRTDGKQEIYKQKEQTRQTEAKLEEQLSQTYVAYQMAREIGDFKAGFLSRTTHALRSPLNGLIGLHQLILSDLCENPEEEREFTEQALERALKLLKLIDEILNVSRLQAGTNKLNIQPFSLSEILKDSYDLTALLAENRNYKYNLVLPEQDVYVLIDPQWLRYVLVGLIETAIAGMEEGEILTHTVTSNSNDKNHQKKLGQNKLNQNNLTIYIDVPQHAFPSWEAIDLATAETLPEVDLTISNDKPVMSLGMRVILNQSILETMGGKFAIYSHPDQDQVTRLSISIPRCED